MPHLTFRNILFWEILMRSTVTFVSSRLSLISCPSLFLRRFTTVIICLIILCVIMCLKIRYKSCRCSKIAKIVLLIILRYQYLKFCHRTLRRKSVSQNLFFNCFKEDFLFLLTCFCSRLYCQ